MKNELCKRCADIYCYMFSPQVTECQDFLPMTNADRVRTMTDVDLAIFINEVKIDGLLRNNELPTSAIDWLDWLKQEAERSEDG